MSGKVLFSTGSFLGEMGTTGGGKLFINSHGKGQGVLLEGVKEFSQSATGELIEKTLDATTGLVKSTKVKDMVKGVTFRRSGSATANQIEFHQTTNAAFINVSGSNPGFNAIHPSSEKYFRARPHFIDFI